MKFWIREVSVKTGGKEFTNDKFTIDFDIPFSTKEEPDISEVKLYNLSNSSISAIQSKGYIIVNAGYKGDTGNILSGKVEELSTEWQGADKITTIKVSDGGVEWRKSTIQKTYAKGSSASSIMSDLAGVLGLEIAEISPHKPITYKLGKTISGDVNTALKRLVKDTQSKMYINKGRLYIRSKEKGTANGFLLKSDTGLVGSPERLEEEVDGKKIIKYKVNCLLNHKVGTDSLIQVRSKTINGNYRVESGRHTGDFKTELTVLPA